MIRRTKLILHEIFAGLMFGVVALGGLAAWRLHQGPIPLDFLTPHLEEALKTEGRGYSIDIDRTVAVWAGWRKAVDIVANNVVVTAPDGSTLAHVPELSLGLSLRAMIRGKLAPTSLDAIGPSLRVIRREDGEFALAFVAAPEKEQLAPDRPPHADPSPGRAVVDFLVKEMMIDADPAHPLSYLRRISILGGQVVFEDRVAGRYFHSPGAEIVLVKGDTGLVGSAALRLHYDGRQADVSIRTGIENGSLDYTGALSFHGVEPAAFATSLPPQLAAISALSMPLSGEVSFSGKLRGEMDRFDYDLLGGAGSLELTDFYREPVMVRSLRLRGNASADFSTVRVEHAAIDLGDTIAVASAVMEPADETGRTFFSLSAELENFHLRELHRYWPEAIHPPARRWVTQNIYDGLARKGTIELAIGFGGPNGGVSLENLEGTLVYDDLAVRFVKTMSPVVGIDGEGTFSRHGFFLGITEASMEGGIALDSGKVDIVNIDRKGEARLVIDGQASGPVPAVLNILDQEPLKFGAKLGFDRTKSGGNARGNLHFELPLVSHITGDMLEVAVKAQLTGASIPDAPFNLAVTEGQGELAATRAGLDLKGKALLNGVPAEIVWRENFQREAPFQRRFTVTGAPDVAQQKALGLPDLSYWTEGSPPTKLTYTAVAGRETTLAVRSDLEPALLRVPEAGWEKVPGLPGSLEIDARVLKQGHLIFDRIQVKTDDTEARMMMEFLPDMSDIARVELQDIRYRGNDAKGEILRTDDGGLRVEIEGDRIDVRHYLTDEYEETSRKAAGLAEGQQGTAGRRMTMKVRFKEAVTGDGRRMYRGAFGGRYDGRNWESLGLYATLGEGAEIKVGYGPGESGDYELLVEANAAGQALRSLGWWDEVQGGSMAISGRRKTIDGPLTGNIWVKDFRLKEAPAGIKMLQIITLVGLPAALAAGEGIGFAGLEGAYVYDKGVLTFKEMEAWGPVGVHVDKGGVMDFNENRIAMTGVVVPANTLQQLLGIIPLFGLIFQEGLIAANFEVSGKIDDPKVEGKPGSLPALGFLRKLFRLKPQEGAGGREGAGPPQPRD